MTGSTREVPSEKDWGDLAGDFDAKDAYKKFHGLSKQDTKKLFAADVLARAQDVRFMPALPFTYYFEGFCEFVLEGAYGDSPAWAVADSFISVLVSRAEADPELLVSNLTLLTNAVRFVVKNQQAFGASESIYGDFYARTESILKSIEEAAGKGNKEE